MLSTHQGRTSAEVSQRKDLGKAVLQGWNPPHPRLLEGEREEEAPG